MVNDPIADMLTRIRNAQAAHHAQITLPHSRVNQNIAQILAAAGYLKQVTTTTKDNRQWLQVTLQYFQGIPAITGIKRLSKPGRRLYQRSAKLPTVLSGQGLAIMSTSQGMMTAKAAKKQHLGGELICTVW